MRRVGEQLTAVEHVLAPDAAGVNVIAQQAANFNVAAGFTQPDVTRNMQVVFSAAWDGGNIEVTGVDARGRTVASIIVAAAGTTVQGSIPYATITRIRNLGNRTAGTVDIQCGTRLGLAQAGVRVYKAAVDSANEAVGTVNAANGTIIPTTAPNGTRNFTFWYAYGG